MFQLSAGTCCCEMSGDDGVLLISSLFPCRHFLTERLDIGDAAIRPCRPVPGSAVGVLHPDLASTLELRGIRVPRTLALPEVEDSGRIPALLRRLAPVAGR